MLSLNELAKQSLTIARARGLKDADVLKHLAGEVLEAQDAFTSTALAHPDSIDCYAYELADVIICALSASAQYHIDIERAIENKLTQNAKRIPHQHSTLLSTGRNSIDE